MFGEKETYKYVWILESDTMKQVETKGKMKKEYLKRTKKLPKTKQYSSNIINGINTWGVPFVRYLIPFLKWTREELKQMDLRTRKLMTMHPRINVDRRYVSGKNEGRELDSIEDNVNAWKQ